MKETQKMQSKDFITCGIFSALSLVALMIATVANITPYTSLLYTSLYALLNGTIFLLVCIKVPKSGAILVFSVVPFAFMASRGWENMILAGSIAICALLSELILKKNRNNSTRIAVAYMVYTTYISISGSFGMFVFPDVYCNNAIERGINPTIVEGIRGLLNYGTWAGMIALTALASVGGIALGRSLMKKHLHKAGVA